MEDLAFYLGGLPLFAAYFFGGAAMLVIFTFIYTQVTPHNEWKLIRENNTAAAIGLGGALIGYALPLASAMAHSVSLIDFLIWGVVALIVQLLAFFLVRLVFPQIVTRLEAGETAAATAYAAISVAAGVLNAASMTW